MANEKRLIYAGAFWNRLNQVVYDIFTYPERPCDHARVGYYIETIETVLKQTKTVDAVEVVRCKHCVSFGIYESTGNGYCMHRNGLIDPRPYDFCSYGERKDNG